MQFPLLLNKSQGQTLKRCIDQYISQRDEAAVIIHAVPDSIVQQVGSVRSVAPQSVVYGGKQPKDRERAY